MIPKKGDSVSLSSADGVLKRIIQEGIFTGIKLDTIRYFSKLSEGVFYKVVDVCITCEDCRVLVEDKSLTIRFKDIKQIKLCDTSE